MKKMIIQKITLAHCARGTQTCSKCREFYTHKYCLLDICPDGYAARRVIELEINGEKVWREFDIIKIFENYDEAAAYAKNNHVPLIQTSSEEPDSVLMKLEQQLPANWSMAIENDRLIIKRKEPAYQRFVNLINAPVMVLKKEQQKNEENAKKEGTEIYCTFVFQLESRWFPERLEWARKTKKRLPDYMSRNYCLFLLEKIGMQDEYTSIFPEEASREMYLLENKFREIFDVCR